MSSPTTPQEPSAWLRSTSARRTREVERLGIDLGDPATPLVIAPLAEPGRHGEQSDRTCDRCRRYVPTGQPFHGLMHKAAPRLLLTGGLCDRCADREVGR